MLAILYALGMSIVDLFKSRNRLNAVSHHPYQKADRHAQPLPWRRHNVPLQEQSWPQRGRDIMNTQELAKTFTDMCAKGEFDAAGKKFWSDDIVSREPMTGDMAELKGRKAVEGKTQWWNA